MGKVEALCVLGVALFFVAEVSVEGSEGFGWLAVVGGRRNVEEYPRVLIYTVGRGRKQEMQVKGRRLMRFHRTEAGIETEVVESNPGLTGFGIALLPPNDRPCYTTWIGGTEPEVVNCGFGSDHHIHVRFWGGDEWTKLNTDHLTPNLYWVDTTRSVLGVTNVENNASVTLFSDCHHQPDGFSIDPYVRSIFACEHKLQRLVRRSADGTGEPEMIEMYNGTCQGMTLSHRRQMIYYVIWNDESMLAFIHQVKYDGTESKILYDNRADRRDFFGIKHFKGKLYILSGDPNKEENFGEKIIRLDVDTRVSEVFLEAPPDLFFRSIIFTEYKLWKNISNPCANSKCSQICLLSHNAQSGYKCACGYGYELVDESVCVVNGNNKFQHPCPDSQIKSRIEAPEVGENTRVNYGLIIGLALLGVCLLAVVVGWIIFYVRMKLRSEQFVLISKYEFEKFMNGGGADEDENSLTGVEIAYRCPFNNVISPTDLVIDRSKVLGKGEFGVVYQGTLCGSDVAVKQTRHAADFNADYFRTILSEIKIMAYIGKHAHIIEFKGADISQLRQGAVHVVVELSPVGNLLGYVREKVTPADDPPQYVKFLDVERRMDCPYYLFVSWAKQIATGMEYLSEKKVLHGDLAARNVLVFRNNHVKITDFGLSKQLYQYKNYTKKGPAPLPWRWLAIESMEKLEFSTQTDVWAYGVTLWEIYSYGRVPYPEHHWTDNFVGLLKKGTRLPKPEAATSMIYQTMLRCWELNPSERPSFKDLRSFFSELLESNLRLSCENAVVGRNEEEDD